VSIAILSARQGFELFRAFWRWCAGREEVAAVRWENVDFRAASLWVKDKVAKEGRKIPLTPYLSSRLPR